MAWFVVRLDISYHGLPDHDIYGVEGGDPFTQDMVNFQDSMSTEEVRKSLIDHDGYSSDIIVEREGGEQDEDF